MEIRRVLLKVLYDLSKYTSLFPYIQILSIPQVLFGNTADPVEDGLEIGVELYIKLISKLDDLSFDGRVISMLCHILCMQNLAWSFVNATLNLMRSILRRNRSLPEEQKMEMLIQSVVFLEMYTHSICNRLTLVLVLSFVNM